VSIAAESTFFPRVSLVHHHETAGKLHQSVLDGCEFCRVLYDRFEDGQGEDIFCWYDGNEEEIDGDSHEEVECYITYNYDRNRRLLHFVQAAPMRHLMLSVRVYADEGMRCYCSLERGWKESVLC
jgi:hypothetical protein